MLPSQLCLFSICACMASGVLVGENPGAGSYKHHNMKSPTHICGPRNQESPSSYFILYFAGDIASRLIATPSRVLHVPWQGLK